MLVLGGVRGFVTQTPLNVDHRAVTQRRPRARCCFAVDATNFDCCHTEQWQWARRARLQRPKHSRGGGVGVRPTGRKQAVVKKHEMNDSEDGGERS